MTLYVAATESSVPKLKAVADCLTDGAIGASPWPDGALKLEVPDMSEVEIAKQLIRDSGLILLDRM